MYNMPDRSTKEGKEQYREQQTKIRKKRDRIRAQYNASHFGTIARAYF